MLAVAEKPARYGYAARALSGCAWQSPSSQSPCTRSLPGYAVSSPRSHYPQSEEALALLWSRAHTLAEALVTEDGQRLRVAYPGRRSSGAGPDFRDAALVTESGGVIVGDVELHLNAGGWRAHGHHIDANYNGVALHVVFSPKAGSATRLQSGMDAPIAALEAVAARLEAASADAMPDLPGIRLPRDDEGIAAALDAAGDARFLAKSRGFGLELGASDADEVLYRGLMDALGYATNRKPFGALAARVRYRTLAALRDTPRGTRPAAAKALLLGASGLMGSADGIEGIGELRRIRGRLPYVKPMAKREWRLFRVRPSNHPARRVVGAALIVEGCLDDGLASAFGKTLMLEGGGRGLVARMATRPYVGVARARDMLVNVALPFLHAYGVAGDTGQGSSGGALARAALDAYAAAPKLQENEITREMRRLCGIDGKARLTARRQQGLIQLYRTGVMGAGRAQGLCE